MLEGEQVQLGDQLSQEDAVRLVRAAAARYRDKFGSAEAPARRA